MRKGEVEKVKFEAQFIDTILGGGGGIQNGVLVPKLLGSLFWEEMKHKT